MNPKPMNAETRTMAKIARRSQRIKSKISVKNRVIQFIKKGLRLQRHLGIQVKLANVEFPMSFNMSDRHAVYAPKIHKISYCSQRRAAKKRKNRKS